MDQRQQLLEQLRRLPWKQPGPSPQLLARQPHSQHVPDSLVLTRQQPKLYVYDRIKQKTTN